MTGRFSAKSVGGVLNEKWPVLSTDGHCHFETEDESF
jgi:hypothetical protein